MAILLSIKYAWTLFLVWILGYIRIVRQIQIMIQTFGRRPQSRQAWHPQVFPRQKIPHWIRPRTLLWRKIQHVLLAWRPHWIPLHLQLEIQAPNLRPFQDCSPAIPRQVYSIFNHILPDVISVPLSRLRKITKHSEYSHFYTMCYQSFCARKDFDGCVDPCVVLFGR